MKHRRSPADERAPALRSALANAAPLPDLRCLIEIEETAGLSRPEPAWGPPFRRKFRIASLLHAAIRVRHHDPAYPGSGREPVCDGDHGLAPHHPAKHLPDGGFDIADERTRRLVEKADHGVPGHDPCRQDPLSPSGLRRWT